MKVNSFQRDHGSLADYQLINIATQASIAEQVILD